MYASPSFFSFGNYYCGVWTYMLRHERERYKGVKVKKIMLEEM